MNVVNAFYNSQGSILTLPLYWLCHGHLWLLESILRQNRPSSSKTTNSGSRLLPNISQSNSPWTSTGYVSGKLPEIKAHIGPESLSLFFNVHTYPLFGDRCCPKCSPHTKWHFLLWTPRGLPLPLMQPWEFEQTVIQTRLWIWIHSVVFHESHCFLCSITLYI